MNAAHLHLLLTHLPVVGILGVILVVAIGLWWQQEAVQRVGLAVAVLVGLAGGAAYLTGEGAEEMVEHQAGVAESVIEQHEDVAKVATIGSALVAVLSAGTLLLGLRRPPRRFAVVTVLLGALAVGGLMAYTANLGGRIGHPEAYSVQPSFPETERD